MTNRRRPCHPSWVLAAGLLALSVSCTRGPRVGKAEAGPHDYLSEALSEVPPRGEPATPGDWLVRRLGAEPDTLNPIIATDVYEGVINEFVYESLVQRNPKTLDFEPQLARSWESSPDGLVHTFHLRPDVRFHDGSPLTADDVLYSYERIQDPNALAARFRVYFIDVAAFEKIDDRTVRCTYKNPYFRAFEVCGSFIPVLPKHVFDDGTDFNKHAANRSPVGTGPLRFVRWETGRFIELKPNSDYYDPSKALHFSRIVFKVITDDNVALQVFKEQGIDTVELTAEQWVRQTGSKRFERIANKLLYDTPSYGYIGWNLRRELFSDRRVRQALTYLLPRHEIARKIYHGMARVVCSPVFYLTDYYNSSLLCRKHDPEKAKALLAEAGWTRSASDGVLRKRDRTFAFELMLPTESTTGEPIATIFQEELAKVGIGLTIRKLDWAAFLKQIKEWKFDACMLGWGLSLEPDPYQLWHSSGAGEQGSSNHVGFANVEADRLIEAYRVSFDKAKRIELLHRFQEIIYEEQPYTFLFSQKSRLAVNRRMVNIHFYPAGTNYREWYVPRGEERYASAALQ